MLQHLSPVAHAVLPCQLAVASADQSERAELSKLLIFQRLVQKEFAGEARTV